MEPSLVRQQTKTHSEPSSFHSFLAWEPLHLFCLHQLLTASRSLQFVCAPNSESGVAWQGLCFVFNVMRQLRRSHIISHASLFCFCHPCLYFVVVKRALNVHDASQIKRCNKLCNVCFEPHKRSISHPPLQRIQYFLGYNYHIFTTTFFQILKLQKRIG